MTISDQMTKILGKHISNDDLHNEYDVYKAMQEYADQQSAEKDTQLKDLHQQLSSLKKHIWTTVEDDNEMLSKRVKELESALGMLVALKTHKDAFGKNKEYEEQQPLAWEQARKLLNVGI